MWKLDLTRINCVCVCLMVFVCVWDSDYWYEFNCPIWLTMISDGASPKTFYCGFRWFYFPIWVNLVFSMHLRMHSARCRWFDCDVSPILPNLANVQTIHPILFDPIRYRWAICRRRSQKTRQKYVCNVNSAKFRLYTHI